jgi:hypothetical protein
VENLPENMTNEQWRYVEKPANKAKGVWFAIFKVSKHYLQKHHGTLL